jgi:two-component system osmolarity sensor histidine kinase EnvZ
MAAEAHRRSQTPGLALRYGLLALAISGLMLLGLQLLVGRQLARQQRNQLVAQVSANLLLGAVALERFSPQDLADLSGMRLVVGSLPPRSRQGDSPPVDASALRREATALKGDLCRRLQPCPAVLPAQGEPRGLWVAMESPLEQVWLFVPLPPSGLWPPDPGLLSLSLGIGGLGAGLLFQLLEVQRPLRQLQRALGQVGLETHADPVLERGSGAVRQLSRRFNAMLERLAGNERERRIMLAGIAHDLKAPLTRLRLRLEQAGAETDLAALERITEQFLLFAGAEAEEAPVRLPLQELLAETAAMVDSMPLTLNLQPLNRQVRPISLARAVANLLENAMEHGRPPLQLELLPWNPEDEHDGLKQEGFEIRIWDSGPGISVHDWPQALTPFLRLDPARGGNGHSGLGLAIAARVARDHGGALARLEAEGRFGVALRGRSLPQT